MGLCKRMWGEGKKRARELKFWIRDQWQQQQYWAPEGSLVEKKCLERVASPPICHFLISGYRCNERKFIFLWTGGMQSWNVQMLSSNTVGEGEVRQLQRKAGSFVLHLPIFYLLGFCWDDHSRPQMCWDRSQQLPSQTPTIHPSSFFWLNSFSVPKTNVASLQRYMCWDFVGMTIQTMINHWKSESVV